MSGNYSGWDHSAHCDLRKHIQKDETQATEGKHLDRFDFIVVMEETTVNVHLVLSTFITGYSLSVIITEDCAKGNRKTMYVLNNLISHKPWQQQVCPSRVQNSSAHIMYISLGCVNLPRVHSSPFRTDSSLPVLWCSFLVLGGATH